MRGKFRRWIVLAVLMLAASLITLIGCAEEKESDSVSPEISLNLRELLLDRYETGILQAEITGSDAAVEWESSDETVAIVTDGLVEAKGEGETQITATVEDVSAECTVTVVDSGERPILTADTASETLMEGDVLTWSVRAQYKNADIDAELIFSSSDEETAEVSADGKITAKPFQAGREPAIITVSAEWKGFAFPSMTKTVTVVEDASFELETKQVSLSTSSPEGTEYESEAEIPVNVTLRGETPENPDVSVKAADENVAMASFADGICTIAAVGKGETLVEITYTTPAQSVFTETIKVSVLIPVVDDDAGRYAFALDLNQETVSADFSDKGLTLTEVVRSDDEQSVLVRCDDSVAVFDKEKLEAGEAQYIVYTNKVGYRTQGIAATRFISSESDFEWFVNELIAVGNAVTAPTEGQYYLLTTDLDFSGRADFPAKNGMDIRRTFAGTLNGNGHSIKNAGIPARGLFNQLYGTVKNLALIDARYTATTEGAFIANVLEVGGLISNVAVTGSVLPALNAKFGGIAQLVANTARIENCVISVDLSAVSDNSYPMGAVAQENRSALVDIFAVCPEGTELYNTGQSGNPSAQKVVGYTDETAFGRALEDGKASIDGWAAFWRIDAENDGLYFGEAKLIDWRVPPALVDCTEKGSAADLEKGADAMITYEQIYAKLPPESEDFAIDGILSLALNGEQLEDEQYAIENDGITLKRDAIANLKGEQTLDIGTSSATYRIKVLVVLAAIGTKEELQAFFTEYVAQAAVVETDGEVYSGEYVILTADIDCKEGYTHPGTTATGQFAGIFDGRGFAIKNFTSPSGNAGRGALFRFVAASGIIENLAVLNETHLVADDVGGGLAHVLYGSIRNCFVEVYNTAAKGAAGGLVSIAAPGSSISNCIVKATFSSEANHAIIARDNRTTISNCYGISSCEAMTFESRDTASAVDCVCFSDETEFGVGVNVLSAEDGWSAYWTLDTASKTLKFGKNVVLDWSEGN